MQGSVSARARNFFSMLVPVKWLSGRSDPSPETTCDSYSANMPSVVMACVYEKLCLLDNVREIYKGECYILRGIV